MRALMALLFIPAVMCCGQAEAPLQEAIRRVDALSADVETKPVVAAAVAERLGMHRNRLALLRQQTGRSYAQIMAAKLKSEGAADARIAEQLRLVAADVEKRVAAYRNERYEGADPGAEVRPLALVSAGAEFTPLATFYSLTPQVGVAWGSAYVTAGLPYYRTSSSGFSAGGVGDAFVTAGVNRESRGTILGFALTAGLPTGDRDRGLGAGKVTVDGTATLGRRFGTARIFGNAGLANSVFSNAAYQRPYISTGPAAHFSIGGEVRAARRLTLGGGAFAVRPFGSQMVYSRVIEESVPAEVEDPANPGKGRGAGRMKTVFETVTRTEVEAVALRDHGPNFWAEVAVARGVTLQFGVARSIPFSLTVANVGMHFDVGRLFGAGTE